MLTFLLVASLTTPVYNQVIDHCGSTTFTCQNACDLRPESGQYSGCSTSCTAMGDCGLWDMGPCNFDYVDVYTLDNLGNCTVFCERVIDSLCQF